MVIVSEPTLLLRGLKSSELACLLALTLAGEPVRVSWLGRVTGLSPHTLTSTLNTLQALGLAQDDGQRSGWHLAASLQEQLLARAEALPAAGECHGSSPLGAGSSQACQALPAGAGSPPTSHETVFRANDRSTAQVAAVDGARLGLPPGAALAPGDQSGDQPGGAVGDGANREPAICRADLASVGSLEALNESASIGGVVDRGTAHRGVAMRGTAMRDALQEEGEENLESISTPGLESPAARRDLLPRELPEPAQVERILAATAGLFGEAVHGPPTRYPDPRRLLAAIAHVYSRRQGLRKPARVVYSMLRDGIPPPEHLLENPLAYLPVDYLQAAGLPVPERAGGAEPGGWADEAEWGSENLLFAHSLDIEAELPHASLSLPVLVGAGREPSGLTAAGAWRMAVEVLRSEMPRQAYEKHLRPTCLLRFEPGGFCQASGSKQAGDSRQGGCLFTVRVVDEYSREWLAQRVGRSLSRTLEGICQAPARVEFVVQQ